MPPLLSAVDAEPEVTVPEDTSVRVFRDPDKDAMVVAKKDDNIIPLDVRDISVSREYSDENDPGYVEFFQENGDLYICDTGTTSTITQITASGENDLPEDDAMLINTDCIIKIGYETELEIEEVNAE